MANAWIVANRQGLANTLSNVERRKLIEEVIQNARDTDATNITVTLTEPKRGYSILIVEDNDPAGFADMRLSYEMFADTAKRDNPEKAGRFTFGEKRVLALSRSACIASTKGTVNFEMVNGKEVRTESPRKKRLSGTIATFEIKMDEAQYKDACEGALDIIPNENVALSFNGTVLSHLTPVREFKAKLETELAHKETRQMHRVTRETAIRLYDPKPGRKACLFELGIPVVEIDCHWNIDIRQRIPLNMDRDNVNPKYRQTLLALILNQAYEILPDVDAAKPWVKEARGSEIITKDAFESTNKQIWGEHSVVPDPNDLESINRAVAEGYSVIRGATKDEYKNNRKFGVALSSSQVFPTPKPYSDDPNAPQAKIIPESQWTAGMKLIYDYTRMLSKELLGCALTVRFVDTNNGFAACFGKESGAFNRPRMDYNYKRLGKAFFAKGVTVEVDALIIHEFGHFYESNHLSKRYYDALCDLGARLKKLALEKPQVFEEFMKESAALV